MLFDSPLWNSVMIITGELTIVIVVALLLCGFLLVAITLYSIHNGRFYFPRLLKSGLVLMEGLVKAICKLIGVDDKEMVTFFIRLHNAMNVKGFASIPVDDRAVFLPQCLRNARCPAHLTPEGIKCQHCNQCGIGKTSEELEGLGYRVFIVPGSTFIKRIVKKYHPKAIIGVGCLMEVKEGLEMCDQFGLAAMGVVTLKDGCVETVVNWGDILETAGIGLDNSMVPDDFHISAR
ncbi:MAG: DUF116 domain-containing protein [Methanomicrobiales archaeon]|nr:DUF116 domain-containing protein [Methanomicrobiales archaeon]